MIGWFATVLISLLPSQLSVVPNFAEGEASAGHEMSRLRQRADSGDPKAQVDLGVIYATGDGVPVNKLEAVRWFHTAATLGDAAGEYWLGEMYLTGRGWPRFAP